MTPHNQLRANAADHTTRKARRTRESYVNGRKSVPAEKQNSFQKRRLNTTSANQKMQKQKDLFLEANRLDRAPNF